jgi:DNA-binding CsgD family transcriptional regulator
MSTRPPLIGRQAELERLRRVLVEGAERAVVVVGQPGIGKSVVIERACAEAHDEGWRVVRVLGTEAEEAFALGGLNQVVLALKDCESGLDERDRAVLAPVFGGDADAVVSVLPLTAAVLNLAGVAAQTQPVVLVVDDVQWLDAVSAEVIGALGRRIGDARVRILAGQRVPCESAFSLVGWSELRLEPLDASDAARLLDRTAVALTASGRAAILAESAGNPLALCELPRCADQIGDGAGALPLTERLVAAFGGRLGGLGAGVRTQLLMAALDGIVGPTTGKSRARFVMENVAPAVQAGLLVVDPWGAVVFRHPLVRSAVVHQASPQELRDAHRDLAGLYGDVPMRHAVHRAAAATGPDQQAADLLAEAAKISDRRGGSRVAVEWLRRAVELSGDPERRAELIGDAVFTAARGGLIDDVQDLMDSAATETEAALSTLAYAYRALHADGDVTATHPRLLAALANAEALDDATVNRLAQLLLFITLMSGSSRHKEQTTAALLPVEARLNPAIAVLRLELAEVINSVSTLRAMFANAVQFLPQMHPRWVVQLSQGAFCIDAAADFHEPLQQAFTQMCEQGASIDAIEGGRAVIQDLGAIGCWEQAHQVGVACLQMAQSPQGSELARHQILSFLGILAANQGDLQTARRSAAEVTAWAQPRALAKPLLFANRIAVRVAIAEGDFEAAYQAALRIGPPGQFLADNFPAGEDMLDLVEALVNTGRVRDARAHAAEAVRLGMPAISPRVAALTSAISAMTAPEGEAAELFEAALANPGITEFPFDHARIALAYGRWLRRRRPTEARAPLSLAADVFDRLGARPWAERTRAELLAAEASVSRSPGDTARLTTQERRVAEMAADGATSKEIAVAMSRSTRTVDAHLQRAFRKLGVNRRAQLLKAMDNYDLAPGGVPDDAEIARTLGD